ncbi:MAG: MFS transporter [Anaerolineae bacterium]|nr:MFS transporter [Anaerolineae bacterium]
MSKFWLGLSRDNFLVMLSMLFWGAGEGLWFYVQPLYIKSLGADSLEIGFVLSLAPVLMVLILIPSGILADRHGRKKMMVGGSVMGTVAVLLLASARDWRQSIVGFLLYWGSTGCLPAFHAYVAHASDRKDLNRNFSLIYAAFAVGMIIFPTVGGFLAERVGFPLALCTAAAFYAVSTLLVVAVREQPVAPTTAGFGLRDVLSNSRLMIICTVSVFIFLAMFLGQPFAPNYVEEVVGLELVWIGFLGSAHALGATVLGVVLGKLSEGVAGLVVGQALVLVSLLLLLRFQAIPVLALSFFLRGAFNACRALTLGQMGKVMGETASGLAYGLLNTAMGLPWVLAPYMAAWLYTSRPALPFMVSAAMIAAMMIVSVVLLRDPRGVKGNGC